MNTSLRKPLLRVALATALVLLVPLLAMQFTREVAWSPADFVVAGLLLMAGGSAIVLARQRIARRGPRLAAVAAIVAVVALAWAELAVGLLH